VSPLPDPVPLSDVHRVLVTKLRHHGDVLLTSPVFTTLARAIPSVEIDALVYVDSAALLAVGATRPLGRVRSGRVAGRTPRHIASAHDRSGMEKARTRDPDPRG